MVLVDLLGWWYSRGWAWTANQLFVKRTHAILNFFSIGDLLKTLLAPFRQDSTNVKGAPISVRLQVFGGNIISRIFGLIIRSTLIVVGLLLTLSSCVVAAIATALWPLLPVAPVAAIALMLLGVGK
jgi:hypothetical protein